MWLRDSIVFSAPPRDVRIGLIPGANDAARQLRDAEQAAFERGRIEGERALSEQLVRQRAELVELHNGAIAALQRAVPQVIQHTEEAMIALAFEIAQKLVAEIPMTREMIGAAVREALQQVEDTTELNILLHPEDLQLLGDHPANITGELDGSRMRFTASRDVSRGGCLVQTRFGIIDNRRETKLARLGETLGIS